MKIPFAILSACLILLSASCQRDDGVPANVGTFIFYKQTTAGSFSVYINNVLYGSVPFVDRTPACNTSEGLRLRFDPGTYSVDVRDNSSQIYQPPVQITLGASECRLYRVP